MISKNDITMCFLTLERHEYLRKSIVTAKDFPNKIVYDNGTTNPLNKNLIKALALKNKAKLITAPKNEGLTKGWNQCIINSNTDWVCLCPDDLIFREGWFEDFAEIIDKHPHVKIVFGIVYDMFIIHKSIIPKFGWLDERYYQAPSSEDYDMHLRLVETIGFSPFTLPGDHIQGKEREIRLARDKLTKEQYFSKKNFTYWCKSPFSKYKPFCEEMYHPKTSDYFVYDKTKNNGYEFHAQKWEQCNENDSGALLNVDGQFWRRKMPDKVFYPEITEEYRKKYEDID